MSHTPANPVVRPQIPTSTVAAKPDAPQSAKSSSPKAAILGAGAAALVLIVAGIAFFGRGRGQPPPLNADTVTLVKFVASDAYGKLNYDQQRQFMGVLEDREDNDELKDAFNSGKIDEKQYRTALLEAWAGEQLKRSEKYARTNGEAAKLKYLNELSAKKAKSKSAKPKNPSDTPTRHESIKRDPSLEDARMASLPPEVREQWQKFREAHSAAKAARDRVAESKPNP